MTYVREGNFAEADKQFLDIATTAHDKESRSAGSAGLRHMAEYQSDDNVALKHLKLAEDSLQPSARAFLPPTVTKRLSRILRVRVGARCTSGQSVAGARNR